MSVKILRRVEEEAMAAVLEHAPVETGVEALAAGIAQVVPWQIYLVKLIEDPQW